jgi:hypothetical protein
MEVKKDMINATRGGMNMSVSTPETGKLNCKKFINPNSVYFLNCLNYFRLLIVIFLNLVARNIGNTL